MLGSKNFRPTVAVLGFKNQMATPETDWVSTSLSDMLASELPRATWLFRRQESLCWMKMDLALPSEASYSQAPFKKCAVRCIAIMSCMALSLIRQIGGVDGRPAAAERTAGAHG